MITDARTVPAGTELSADVCIVGAGPAGISMARELGAAGVRVVLLESGGRDPDRFAAALNRGESVGRPYFRLERSRIRAFGGTSRHWHDDGYRSRPLDDIDFERRDAVPHSGWPIGRADLDPYYERAHVASQLSGVPFDDDAWGAPLDPELAERWRGLLRATVFRIGAGAPVFFASHDAALERQPGVTVVLHATVTDLELDEHRRAVRSVTAQAPDRRRFTVASSAFVLAAGGIENPRFLLLHEHQRRGGLGNEHDLVGRCFMEHLHMVAGTLNVSDPSWRRRLPSDDVVDGDVRYRHTISIHPEVLRREGLCSTAFYLATVVSADAGIGLQSLRVLRAATNSVPLPPGLPRHVANVARRAPDIARHLRRRRQHLPLVPLEVLEVTAIAEQTPNPASRVTLGKRTDAFGQRVARLDWRTTDEDVRSVRRSFDILERELRAVGAGTFANRHAELFDEAEADDLFAPRHTVGEYHHMGTTRMHDDPRHGVVDRDCRVHGTDNLYVAGSSVFPTSGHANPTLTIVALALRLADHVRDEVAGRRIDVAGASGGRTSAAGDGGADAGEAT